MSDDHNFTGGMTAPDPLPEGEQEFVVSNVSLPESDPETLVIGGVDSMGLTVLRPSGAYKCEGCNRVYAEYVNGCVQDHFGPRKVRPIEPAQ